MFWNSLSENSIQIKYIQQRFIQPFRNIFIWTFWIVRHNLVHNLLQNKINTIKYEIANPSWANVVINAFSVWEEAFAVEHIFMRTLQKHELQIYALYNLKINPSKTTRNKINKNTFLNPPTASANNKSNTNLNRNIFNSQ